MIRFLVTVFMLLTCFVFQGSIFQNISIAGAVPNLVLILTVSLGLMRGRKTGMIVGLFCGLLLDIFAGPSVGFYALILMYIGYGNGYFNKVFFPEDVKLPIGMIIVSDFIYGCVSYVLLFLLRGRTDFSFYFKHIIVPECVYTILATIIVYPVVFVVNRALERRELRRAKKFV